MTAPARGGIVNRFFIGERVRWMDKPLVYLEAGAGLIDSIYLDSLDRLTYRIDREGQHQNRTVLLHEHELEEAKP